MTAIVESASALRFRVLGGSTLGFLLALGTLPACAGAPPTANAIVSAPVGEPWASICPPVVGGADVTLETRSSGGGAGDYCDSGDG